MNVLGTVDPLETPEMREKAEKRVESLFARLKETVKVDSREIGTLRKEVTVTVPGDVIGQQFNQQFSDMASDAVLPGFRKGRAPKALVQKRFGGEIRESLKSAVLGQSYFAAVEKIELKVLGDPLFRITTDAGVKLMEIGEALTHVHLPENQDFSYTCEVEVKPAFDLPEVKGVKVKSPAIDITDAMVNDALERQGKIRGRLEIVHDAAADDDDQLMADVTLSAEGKEVKREANLQLGVRPTRLDGIQLPDLDKRLKGAKVGSHITVECKIPDDYERADLRGKTAQFKFDIHEIKRLKPLTIAELVEQIGAKDEAQLREFMRDDLEVERDRLIRRAEREQVLNYLLENCKLDLPNELSARQTDRAVMRSVIDLRTQGVPPTEIEARIDELRTTARQQVADELKLQFILERVAETLQIRVTDEEVNTEIARIARRYNRRFDRMRDELIREGLLMQLADQIRQDKAVARILQDAEIERPAA